MKWYDTFFVRGVLTPKIRQSSPRAEKVIPISHKTQSVTPDQELSNEKDS